MRDVLNECRLCPRNCSINRNNDEIGFCGAGNEIVIAKYYLHQWEEPCITGENGSGTIFFSYCNLRCIFCQNYKISTLNYGIDISVERFSEICLELQDRGATNINLVTPTHFVPLIIDGIKLAKNRGLCIPIVYNSSGYENVSTIKMLDGIVDVYLPDFKYYGDEYAIKYSKCRDYFKYASVAIDEMVRKKGECIFDNYGNIISAGCSKFIHIHSEASVTGNIDANLIRLSQLGTDTCSKTVTHGAKSTGGKEGTGLCILIILGCPHLMLSHIGGNDCFTLGYPVNFFNHVGTGQLTILIFQRILSL